MYIHVGFLCRLVVTEYCLSSLLLFLDKGIHTLVYLGLFIYLGCLCNNKEVLSKNNIYIALVIIFIIHQYVYIEHYQVL